MFVSFKKDRSRVELDILTPGWVAQWLLDYGLDVPTFKTSNGKDVVYIGQ